MLKQNLQNSVFQILLIVLLFSCSTKAKYNPNKDPNFIELNKLPKDSLTTIKFNTDTLFISSKNNNELISDSFKIINTGLKRLKIKSYTTSCECTKVALKKYNTLPNDSIIVTLYIDKEKLSKGVNNRSILFTGNFIGIYKKMEMQITLK